MSQVNCQFDISALTVPNTWKVLNKGYTIYCQIIIIATLSDAISRTQEATVYHKITQILHLTETDIFLQGTA